MIGAIDIGGTKIAVGLVGERNHLVRREETPVGVEQGFDCAMDRVTAILGRQIEETSAALDGIGIGSTGPLDLAAGRLGDVNTLPGWSGSDPVGVLSSRFGVSAAIENDADAMALAEGCAGSGRGKARFVCITVGTGIGSGILVDGHIYRGAGDSHPELGHIVLDPAGPLCTCGAYGCWEALASGPALARLARELAPEEALKDSAGQLTAASVCALAREGVPWARDAVDQEARFLGRGIAAVVTAFMPDVIALGGSVMNSADLFLDAIRERVRADCRLVPAEKCEIVRASLGSEAGLIGAAEVWRHRFGNN